MALTLAGVMQRRRLTEIPCISKEGTIEFQTTWERFNMVYNQGVDQRKDGEVCIKCTGIFLYLLSSFWESAAENEATRSYRRLHCYESNRRSTTYVPRYPTPDKIVQGAHWTSIMALSTVNSNKQRLERRRMWCDDVNRVGFLWPQEAGAAKTWHSVWCIMVVQIVHNQQLWTLQQKTSCTLYCIL